jgi:acyl-CoA thioester hydrolase
MGRASLIIAQQAYLLDVTGFPSAAGAPHGAAVTSSGGATAPAPGAGALLCEGTIRIGWVEAGNLKPARIPATILEALKQ